MSFLFRSVLCLLTADVALSAAEADKKAAAAAPPTQMAAVSVAAEVPLVKVGELKMIEPRHGAAAVVQGDHIYIIGGLNSDNQPSQTIERLDVKTGRSEIFAQLRFPRFWHNAVLSGGKIHILGGAILGAPLPRDPEAAEAELKKRGAPSAPMRKIMGGRHLADWSGCPFVEVLDLETRTTSHGTPLPYPLYSFGAVAVDDQIAVVGGTAGTGSKAQATWNLRVFETKQNAWLGGPSLPRARQTTAVAEGPLVIVPGGYDGAKASSAVDVFDLRSGKWRSAKPLSRATSAHAAVVLDRYLCLFGDYTRPEELLIYDLAKEESETFTLGYTPARHAPAVVHDRKVYIIGGRAQRLTEPLDIIQVFALRKDVRAAAAKKANEKK